MSFPASHAPFEHIAYIEFRWQQVFAIRVPLSLHLASVYFLGWLLPSVSRNPVGTPWRFEGFFSFTTWGGLMVKAIKDGAIKAFNDSNPSQDGIMFGYGGCWWRGRNLANQSKHMNSYWWWTKSWTRWYDTHHLQYFYLSQLLQDFFYSSSNCSTRNWGSLYQLVRGFFLININNGWSTLDFRANEKEILQCLLLTNLGVVHKKQLLAFQTLQPWKLTWRLEMEWFM